MPLPKRFSYLLSLTLVTGIWTASASPSFSQPVAVPKSPKSSRVIFQPRPGQKSPQRTIGGGRRNDNRCLVAGVPTQPASNLKEEIPLMSLLPKDSQGSTLDAYPTILVYVPPTPARSAELTLEDETGKGLYQSIIDLPATPGVVSVRLPKTEAPLAVGKSYKWVFALMCNPSGPQDPYVEGWVQRIQLDAALTQQLENAKGLEQVILYASSGLWYEASSSLNTLRQGQPTDTNLANAWKDLLQSVGLEGLDAIGSAPLQNK